MKMVIAYIQPFTADQVVKALQAIPQVVGATLTECQGFGRGRGSVEAEPLATEKDRFGTLRKMRVESMIPDNLEETVVQAIRTAAYTGRNGDGKIYVTSIHRAVRIRTGQEGEAGL